MRKFDGILLVSDIDGTLTDENQIISDENLAAIEYFKSHGGAFTIATGRLYNYFYEKGFSGLINCPAILQNGAGIYDFDTEKFIFSAPLDNGYKNVLEFLNKLGGFLHISLCYLDGGFNITDSFLGREENPHKIVAVFDDEAKGVKMRDELKQNFGEKYEVFRSWNTGVEVLQKNATKGAAVLKLKAAMPNIHTTVGIGDYENDVSLLRCTDISFAPENSVELLKPYADYIVSHHNNGAVKTAIDILKTMDF